MVLFQKSSLIISALSSATIPAQFTSTSICPNAFTPSSITCCLYSASHTFPATPIALSPPISFAILFTSGFKSARTTFAPCFKKNSAVSFPMPAAPPVMTAVFPFSPRSSDIISSFEKFGNIIVLLRFCSVFISVIFV